MKSSGQFFHVPIATGRDTLMSETRLLDCTRALEATIHQLLCQSAQSDLGKKPATKMDSFMRNEDWDHRGVGKWSRKKKRRSWEQRYFTLCAVLPCRGPWKRRPSLCVIPLCRH